MCIYAVIHVYHPSFPIFRSFVSPLLAAITNTRHRRCFSVAEVNPVLPLSVLFPYAANSTAIIAPGLRITLPLQWTSLIQTWSIPSVMLTGVNVVTSTLLRLTSCMTTHPVKTLLYKVVSKESSWKVFYLPCRSPIKNPFFLELNSPSRATELTKPKCQPNNIVSFWFMATYVMFHSASPLLSKLELKYRQNLNQEHSSIRWKLALFTLSMSPATPTKPSVVTCHSLPTSPNLRPQYLIVSRSPPT